MYIKEYVFVVDEADSQSFAVTKLSSLFSVPQGV